MSKFVYVDWNNDYTYHARKKSADFVEDVYLNVPPDKRTHNMTWLFYKIHNTPRINRLISLPFKNVWNKYFIDKATRKALSHDGKVCFIFSSKEYKYLRVGLHEYLRKVYPLCKLMYIFNDKVQLYYDEDNEFSIEYLKEVFDIVGTYNKSDVYQYGITMLPVSPHDYSDVELDTSFPESDVVFVGKEKGRLDHILKIYENCTAKGLKCDFHIVDVPREKQKYNDEITYNKRMSYDELLRRVRRSRCVLNIIQEGADGVTLRDYEAIGMNKYLMTNSNAVSSLSVYNEKMLIRLDNLDHELAKLEQDYVEGWKSDIAIPYHDYFNDLENIVFGCI